IIVDDGIKNNNIGIVWLVLLGEVFIVFGKTTAEFARRRIVLFFSFEVSYNLVCDFLRKLLRLEIGFFDVVLIGDLNQRISDYGRVQRFLTDDSTNIIMSVFSLIIFSAILVSYSPVVFVLFLFPTILSSLGTVFLLRRRKRLDFLLFKANSYSQIETYRFLSNMQEIKLQGCENRRCRDWQEKQQQVFDIQKRMLRLQQIQELIVVVSDEIKSILITLALAFSVLSGNLSMGSMLAIQIVVGQLNVPTRQIISFVYSLQDLFMSLARINEIMTKVDEDANKIEECALTGGENIRIEDVEFSYSNRLGNVLNKISIIIPNKKVTAIVGPSGCGKTTLIKMLLGYYRPKRGSIMLGETPLTDINLREWRGRCGVVMQDGVIFSESIERNIANTDEQIDNARLLMAAKMVNADCFISELPLGYKTKIGDDGVDLSKGQKQRLLLARVIYKDPKYIFLDEATNSLDVINEQQIVANMRNFFKDKTVVIAAHRLSTIRNADQIVVINNGAVAEVGNHKTLMAKRGAYYNLINQQI
ncbi:MAG: ATP-binding cassette domain-containing protein, partial [Muribaculaceae bacterium]|nr:ATP-binding cassette domain-containing protein [Muribaculaceae bacterium]